MTRALTHPRSMRDTQMAFTMRLTSVPVAARLVVEEAMVECLRSPSQISLPGQDPLTANWFTAWRTTPGMRRRVDCDQLLSGHPEEVRDLELRLDALAEAWGFSTEIICAD